MRFLSIDPGLDDVRIARWEAPQRPVRGPISPWVLADHVAKTPCLHDVVAVKTDPAEPVEERLGVIARGVQDEAYAWGASLVFVERPAIGGIYRGRQGERGMVKGRGAETLLQSHWALGAIVGALGVSNEPDFTVRLVTPGTGKARRQEHVRMIFAGLRRELPRNKDAIDAIAVGLMAEWDFSAWGE